MRLVTFQLADGVQRSGALFDNDQAVLDLREASRIVRGGDSVALASVQALLTGGEPLLEEARALLARAPADAVRERSAVKLLAPIQPPTQMRDCSCFELHLRQSFAAARRARALRTPDPEATLKAMNTRADDRVIDTFNRQPIYYKCNRFAVIGPDDDVIWPAYSKLLDFELEFGCYIGQRAKDVSRENARAHIYGYTIFNDISARDAQATEMGGMLGPAKGKDFDTANVMGPCLVTADELGDPYDLTMIARVNGEEWGRGNTRDMRWQFEDVIAHISRSETLHPGEFLGSGTVGNGCGLEQLRYLKPDDVVELEVEGIGILRSRIVRPVVQEVEA
ncbi:fumarylacetoacetate hydrolase family protein [Paraburkholderia fungorum]|jgi:2-keto-4-pentenoate hydratase/2-oxohepta-3-ene-1,7-dioic acid hydratase in catechol pathway|uniref:2-keto-4-pentenoate hydratase/2-oxohepta-3-ene-1,7-dioic acid hydratase in catechol pathway n=1 Tax=Paraburkholderia fungorum TaxID=134537 RepID=A0AAW3UUB8_9BURK|nr:fumarylacetoacetate hydrolase family protein [Paraburkholderia fungorum]AJZ58527.1 fumarylacetoacetate (FAA) hydrolase family protein [Paraburkholderia fungorum]MBB4514226.1 2-keto-4-pentenoate hydratase/2-oxohepta-3-ene-1,7-dioic acid hydratase in catechol pathway [Paraburkholderia fungorum]MBB6202232.1 2-keto-4-pentenoate hydratase/2-oxohepta-3-ene-1,7-dioic acid hydratase in catechol pathway [Paraburkholderia fungorum]QLD50697.1 isomerase [Paraburkholderia fungorum]